MNINVIRLANQNLAATYSCEYPTVWIFGAGTPFPSSFLSLPLPLLLLLLLLLLLFLLFLPLAPPPPLPPFASAIQANWKITILF